MVNGPDIKQTWRTAPSTPVEAIQLALQDNIFSRFGYGVGADARDLRTRYIHLARLLHPDANTGGPGTSTERLTRAMANVNDARTILEDSQKCAAWMEKWNRQHGGARRAPDPDDRGRGSNNDPLGSFMRGFDSLFGSRQENPKEKFSKLLNEGSLCRAVTYALSMDLPPEWIAKQTQHAAIRVLRERDDRALDDLLSTDKRVLDILKGDANVKDAAVASPISASLAKGRMYRALRLIDEFGPLDSSQQSSLAEAFVANVGKSLERPLPYCKGFSDKTYDLHFGDGRKLKPQQAAHLASALGLSSSAPVLLDNLANFLAQDIRDNAQEIIGGRFPPKYPGTSGGYQEPMRAPDFSQVREDLRKFCTVISSRSELLLHRSIGRAIETAESPEQIGAVVQLVSKLQFSADTAPGVFVAALNGLSGSQHGGNIHTYRAILLSAAKSAGVLDEVMSTLKWRKDECVRAALAEGVFATAVDLSKTLGYAPNWSTSQDRQAICSGVRRLCAATGHRQIDVNLYVAEQLVFCADAFPALVRSEEFEPLRDDVSKLAAELKRRDYAKEAEPLTSKFELGIGGMVSRWLRKKLESSALAV